MGSLALLAGYTLLLGILELHFHFTVGEIVTHLIGVLTWR